MKRDIGVYLEDIIESIERIQEYVKNKSKKAFENNFKLQDAVVRRFEIIGEAIKSIPQSVKNKYPKIPWKKVAGMRDVLIHEYFEVNLERVWKTIKEDMPRLKKQVGAILKIIDKN